MKKVKIISIGIDEFDRLFVKPEGKSFQFVYRAAMEVNWDDDKKVLYSPKPREWSYQRWFKQIKDAVKDECGITFKIDKNTSWENIDQSIKEDIIKIIKLW